MTTVEPGDGDAVVGAGRVQAWVVGPGLGTDDAAAAVVRAVLAQDVPVLVDADALTVCAQHPQWLRDRTAPTLLTPHDGEFARFGSEVGPNRVGAAERLAADLGVTVLLKGDATVIAEPGRVTHVNATAPRCWRPRAAVTCCPAGWGRCSRRASTRSSPGLSERTCTV